ncbi:MAG: hypothetical protein UY16_C0001G0017 [Candidatus Gottesmanbacteria bacterium GW2011_GWA2_47_9]|uniref:Uncharacterized protein n=2 Tax=Microgenomates group TaxID=1794810 RepID=A0A0G1WEV9_9BACT|nr:MAG: hypothetical protein UV66_C0006G0007 [Candidatus Woesebacteria bacterium GW2011_GWA1_43_12]KKU88863.1 MAG: hypothetical protein UY16_C0001G0017 [Candidatus Gottesmanbacteria bacterium GW2011_GWA2_47_9]
MPGFFVIIVVFNFMNSLKHYILVIAISLLPIVPVFLTSDIPHTHDGPVHLARMAAYYKALADGQILPRWAGDLNYGYGMPLFNFIYHLPYLFSSFFIFLRFSLIDTFKIVLALSFLISGVTMFAFARAFWKDTKKAFLVTIFYQFIPFRIIELWVRGSYGEVYTYALLPLVLYGLTTNRFVLTAVVTALLIISHNSMSLISFGAAALFMMFFSKTNKAKLFNALSLVTGLLLSGFYWLPALLEHRYTYGDLFMKDMYRSHFPPLFNFFIPNFTNRPELQTGGISVQWGIFHVIAVILAILLLFRKKFIKHKPIFFFSLFLIAASLFLMQPISAPLWQNISLLRQFQFPWRLLGLVGLATSLASVSFLAYPLFKKPLIFTVLVVLTIGSTVWYWQPALGFDRVTDESQYWNYPLNTTYFGETDVIWSGGPATKYPKDRIEIIGGQAVVSQFMQNGTVQKLHVSASTPALLVSHTQYFPGWNVTIDGQKTPIEFQNPERRGLITFTTPEGEHNIVVSLGKTKVQLISELVSLSSLSLLVIAFVISTKQSARRDLSQI